MRHIMTRLKKWFAVYETTLLVLAGFGFVSAGMFALHLVAGLVCTGVSCLMIARLNEGGQGR